MQGVKKRGAAIVEDLKRRYTIDNTDAKAIALEAWIAGMP